jgi:hypothetical protein
MKSYLRAPIWVVPLTVAGLVAVLGWWGNQRLRQTVNEEVRSDLVGTLDANVTALEIWATNQVKLASALASEPSLRTLAVHALAAGPLQGTPEAKAVVDELSRYLRTRLVGLGYETAHLVDPNLLVVSTSRAVPIPPGATVFESHRAKFQELFSSGRPVLITPFRPPLDSPSRLRPDAARVRNPKRGADATKDLRADPEPLHPRSDTLMQVAVPIRDDQGIVRGALALVIDPDQEFTRILSVARAGKSGETYVFDRHGLMLSRSRYEAQLRELGLIENRPEVNSAAGLRLADPGPAEEQRSKNAATNARPLIWMVANAVLGGSGVDIEPSRDYRGMPVVGAWRWLPQHGFGVATQLDADEAFEPLRVLNLLFTLLFLLLALCATGAFLASYLGVLWRQRLSQAELKLKQLGQYTLEEKIGEGAMGIVYRARHALMRRETAIKLLLPDRADPLSVQRFEHEVRLSCQLTHPNTIQVYDYGHTPQGVFYYAMELLHGLNLHNLVARFGAQPEGRVVYLLVQICDALSEAHALGLVHRDIKPANIFACDRGGLYDWVKVLDFGLVRPYREGKGSGPPIPAVAEGTPLFMPPEAFEDSGVADPRSDIYSVGALGYYLLTGQYVFEASSDSALYHKHPAEAPVPPSRRSSNPISAEMEETVLRCLEKEPNLRAQSAGELRQLLLTSPAAAAWGSQERASWWIRYRAGEAEQTSAPGAKISEAAVETVKLDLAESV